MKSGLQQATRELSDDGIEQGVSLWQDALRRLSKNKIAVISLVYLICLAIIAVITPLIAPFPYEETFLTYEATAPNGIHWFGTDDTGRDIFTRVLYGSRVSLMVGILATGVSLIIGVTYGAISGFYGGRVDNFMMRVLEILYALPFTFFVIILMVIFERNFYLMFVALGAIQWLTMARIVRGQVVSLKEMEFVEAARSMGVSRMKIIFKHLIPNTTGPIIVYVTLTIPQVILEEAFLSFLGLGVQEPMSSWGTLINDGVSAMGVYPWMLIYPCLTLVMTLFALNFLGDGLRDALDPKASKD